MLPDWINKYQKDFLCLAKQCPPVHSLCLLHHAWYKRMTFFAQFDFTSVPGIPGLRKWCYVWGHFPLVTSWLGLLICSEILLPALSMHRGFSTTVLWAFEHRLFFVAGAVLYSIRMLKHPEKTTHPVDFCGFTGETKLVASPTNTKVSNQGHSLTNLFTFSPPRVKIQSTTNEAVFGTFKYRNQNHMATRKAPVKPSDLSLTAWQSSFTLYLRRPHLRNLLLMEENRSLPYSGLWNPALFKYIYSDLYFHVTTCYWKKK